MSGLLSVGSCFSAWSFLRCDCELKQALAVIVTTDGTRDSRSFPKLLRKTERHVKISKAIVVGAYDNSKVYQTLEQKG